MNPLLLAVKHAHAMPSPVMILLFFIAQSVIIIITTTTTTTPGCYAYIHNQTTITTTTTLVHESSSSKAVGVGNSNNNKWQPLGGRITEYRAAGVEVEQVLTGSGRGRRRRRRRKLVPFQVCLVCRCCMGGGSTCADMPCCFGIDCQLPNKPFGVCAFVPKFCNCTSCAV